MTAVAYAHPTISRFAIVDGMLHIAGVKANPMPAVVQHFSRQDFRGAESRRGGQADDQPRIGDRSVARGGHPTPTELLA
jgi:hypothetical protein